MSNSIVPSSTSPDGRIVPRGISGFLASMAQKTLFSRLKNLRRGRITIQDGDRLSVFGESGVLDLAAVVTVHDYRFYTDIVYGGSVGAGESYVKGFWTADDLTLLIRIIILNRKVLMDLEGGLARLTVPVHQLFHTLRKNTREGSRKNITAHYDLGNDFYSLFLDETMTYSCGIFDHPDCSLSEASIAKYDRICRKLNLSSGDHVLEIGTGWGGFALHAAKNYGCRVTTTTISKKQFSYARELISRSGVDNLVELLLEDYRDIRGTFDKLVSIEMIEAVGHHFLDTFFQCCSDRLKEDGVMLLQCITIEDQVYRKHIRSVDFIKRYIFPGSCIFSITAIMNSVTQGTDMRLANLEDITPHYARTLRTWRERFIEQIDAVRRLGYPESFIRMWEFYLSYCEASFAERYNGDVQMLFTKPCSRRDPILPPLEKANQS
jgi:cyclopropane-fatty-acyl-phospholipid synthase